MPRGHLELEPGEELRAAAHASFRGAAFTSVRATLALGADRVRRRAHTQWSDAATAAGFPPAPADMILVVTDQRVLIGRPTFLGRRPATFESELAFTRIAEVVTARHGLVVGVAFALTNGQVIEIEAIRGRALRRLVEELTTFVTS